MRIWPTAAPEELASYHTNDVVLIDPNKPEPLVGGEKALQWFIDAEKLRPFELIKIIKIQEISEDVLFTEFVYKITPTNETFYYVVFRSTSVWKKIKGGWKINYEQWEQNLCNSDGKTGIIRYCFEYKNCSGFLNPLQFQTYCSFVYVECILMCFDKFKLV